MKKLWKIFEEKEGFLRSENWLHFATMAVIELLLCFIVLPPILLSFLPIWTIFVAYGILFLIPIYLGIWKEKQDEKQSKKFDRSEAIYTALGGWVVLFITTALVTISINT